MARKAPPEDLRLRTGSYRDKISVMYCGVKTSFRVRVRGFDSVSVSKIVKSVLETEGKRREDRMG